LLNIFTTHTYASMCVCVCAVCTYKQTNIDVIELNHKALQTVLCLCLSA